MIAPILLHLLLLAASFCHAIRDANAPWGDNPPRKFRMYWREPGNVLEDLEQFSALYIRHVSCMWTEYGYDNYDDDGENRDGDENWYQGRTTSFRANAAYSLYGIRKRSFAFRKCSEYTYINTFITNMGADIILNATGRLYSGYDDDDSSGYGHAYCYEADDDDQGRELGSGDNDDDNSISATMGCSLEGGNRYVMAIFQGGYCDGRNFLNTTDEMNDYNRAINKVSCDKIWDYSNAFDSSGERVDTAADYLLEYSSACSNYMYEGRCPDPYGIEKAYQNAVTSNGEALQTAMLVLSCISLTVGLVLIAVGYYAMNQKRIHKRISRLFARKARESDDLEAPPQDELPREDENKSSRKRRRKKRRRSRSRKQDLVASEGTQDDHQDLSHQYIEMNDASTDTKRQTRGKSSMKDSPRSVSSGSRAKGEFA